MAHYILFRLKNIETKSVAPTKKIAKRLVTAICSAVLLRINGAVVQPFSINCLIRLFNTATGDHNLRASYLVRRLYISVGQDQLRNIPSRFEEVPLQTGFHKSNDLLRGVNLTEHNRFWLPVVLA